MATISLLCRISVFYYRVYYRITNKVHVGILAYPSGEGYTEVLHKWAESSRALLNHIRRKRFPELW